MSTRKIDIINKEKVELLKRKVSSGEARDMNYFYKRSNKEKVELVKELKVVERIFKDEFKVSMYLVAGTLIGAMREHDFIPYDYDVDVGYMSTKSSHKKVLEEWRYIVCRLSELNLLKRAFFPGHLHCSTKSKYTVDVWTTFNHNNKYYMIPAINGELPSDVATSFKKTTFKGCTFNIPSGYDAILSYMYRDWKVPKMKDWKTFKWKRFLGEK